MKLLSILLCVTLCFIPGQAQQRSDVLLQDFEEVYSWVSLDYKWKNATMKQSLIDSGGFLPENNVPTGIKVHQGEVYIVVSRWFSGVPSALNRVITQPDTGKPILEPFPNWEAQTIGECNAFQFVQAVEIDPNTNRMWIVDTGRSAIFSPNDVQNSCPAKIVIYDLKEGKEVHRYVFPSTVASRTSNYLNDIVLDYVNNEVAFAYITDTGSPGLVVYDVKNDNSYRFEDPLMGAEGIPIHIDGIDFNPGVPINGIAMSPDFKYLYFSPVSGLTLYQVPTAILRHNGSNITDGIRVVGEKPSPGDGMIYAEDNLYFGGLNDSSVYRWNVAEDIKSATEMSEGNVQLNTYEVFLRNATTLSWVDTFAIDEAGFLWFTSPDDGRVFLKKMDFDPAGQANFRIIKTYIKEKSYLSGALVKSADDDAASGTTLRYSCLIGLLSLIPFLCYL